MKHYHTILIGATALAYPIAVRLGGDCLTVEPGFSAGAEFSDAMRAEPVDTRALPPIAAALAAELKGRGILSEDGRLHILAVGGVLCGCWAKCGGTLLMGARATEIVQTGDGFAVTVFHPQTGFTTYSAARVIDTTVRDFMDYQPTFGLLLARDEWLTPFDDGDVYLQRGLFADEFVLRFRVPRGATIPEAQAIADRWLETHRERLGSAQAAGIALYMGQEFRLPVDMVRDGVRYLTSASHPDLMSAVKGGELVCL
ncbi:MAG: hypothetical protein IJ493_02260 [Clostridia bacterium]|nr:hypothetical protein [Clostridia bacterium]